VAPIFHLIIGSTLDLKILGAIKRYVYITINEAPRSRIIVKDSKFEEVDCVDFSNPQPHWSPSHRWLSSSAC
jgi:hypothetical protein